MTKTDDERTMKDDGPAVEGKGKENKENQGKEVENAVKQGIEILGGEGRGLN